MNDGGFFEPSPLRIIPYLNVSSPGIFAVSAAVTVGECADLRLLDPRECVRVIEANRDLIAGVKVRVGRNAGGTAGVAPLDIALEVAEDGSGTLPLRPHVPGGGTPAAPEKRLTDELAQRLSDLALSFGS
jgi:dihydroorotase